MRACFYLSRESKLLPHFDDHLLLPMRNKECKWRFNTGYVKHIHTTFASTICKRPSNITVSCSYQASASRFHFARLFGQFLNQSTVVMTHWRHSPAREMSQPGQKLNQVSAHKSGLKKTLAKIVYGRDDTILFRPNCRVAIEGRQSR